MDAVRAIVARERGDGIRGEIEALKPEDLPSAGVLQVLSELWAQVSR